MTSSTGGNPPGGKGTRTRFSDDFLFLPFVVLHYLQITGDRQILSKNAGFIESPRLNENEQERYEQPVVSEQSASLLDHCLRAMQHGLRYGQHGLSLMGCGDWTWYTGAAGWMYRVAIEHMLGIRIEKSRLMISPSLPASWSEFRFRYRRNTTTWQVHAIRNSSEVSKICSVNLIEDGQEHHIELGFG